jgi:hypothetical protein
MSDAILRFRRAVAAAAAAVPDCAGSPQLRLLIHHEASRLLPDELVRRAA